MSQETLTHHPQRSILIALCLAATWLIWGSTYLAIKFALISFPPFLGMGTRFIAAGLALIAWMYWIKKAPLPTLAQWRNALLIGMLMLGFGMGGTAYSEQTIGSGVIVAFIAIVPAMMALGNLVWKIVPSKSAVVGILCALAGVLMLTQGASFSASSIGLLAITFACIGWVVGSLLSQRVPSLALAPGPMGFGSEMLCGGLVLMVFAALNQEYPQITADWTVEPIALAAWLYLVVAGSLIGFSAYMVLLANTSATVASSYCFVNPVVALVLGVWVGNEKVSLFEWTAAGVILLGVVLVLREKSN